MNEQQQSDKEPNEHDISISENQLKQAHRIEPWLGRSFTCGSCGQQHQVPLRKVVLERGAMAALPAYAQERGLRNLLLVSDRRTAEAAGRKLLALCEEAQLQAQLCVLADDEHGELAADERAVVQLLLHVTPATQAIVAVGAGTLHDIVRFAAHRSGRVFLSVPTAPSVDGFASVGAPLILGGFKQTIPACSPEAIFGDLAVLATAPRPMVAAGFGDMLGKYTSLADWELGRVLLDEPLCELAAEMTRQGLELCIRHTEEIAAGTEKGLRKLMEGLLLSGISMLIVGHSRPASGGEHHLSHYWEMKFLQAGRRALLHGAKVGVAAVKMAALYREAASRGAEAVRQSIRQRLADPGYSAPDSARAAIAAGYGAIATQAFEENAAELDPARRTALQRQLAERLGSRWDAVQAICRSVPAPERLADLLAAAGGPVTADQLGVEPQLVDESLRYAKYVRNRYTIMRLHEWL
ncbi:sn-glycerol-1-phosphate dehydrogenase [Paenibacillus allorhizosphaerae]|uniref:Glycerol-1-phosphate dehydrogenase [NAD(P)+] n=1 Tax=Paenibacillus allorhizosphaerae TaxID=2849866 RepID=A0ABN7TIE9_9BACL|nr:sn-glycerol-1-phosphate dehydrogenase [Paenibacillus allorhizosphaerae]CAG7632146.1 Glycerol-1-phosphate dehydrogenase [NAD(P)+] [Paenibacillus allorhizosphaerae]